MLLFCSAIITTRTAKRPRDWWEAAIDIPWNRSDHHHLHRFNWIPGPFSHQQIKNHLRFKTHFVGFYHSLIFRCFSWMWVFWVGRVFDKKISVESMGIFLTSVVCCLHLSVPANIFSGAIPPTILRCGHWSISTRLKSTSIPDVPLEKNWVRERER